ncbi:MAG: RNA-binding transcriptional accessory protein [Burkholderiales bacterium]|nr:RNA-binding transcriptional accessory protein [Burkholderiales bacterium]MDR4518562.1 RNA-binding transcriptional accessory protein [Nitrosomonas sp.]
MPPSIEHRLALEIDIKPTQIKSTIKLLDDGATVPFIARYRKEMTGGLTDVQLRLLNNRLQTLRELEKRRAAIIATIEKQNKMTPALSQAITRAEDKATLEDLYLPYRNKRRTKAQMAIEAGLEPLASKLLNNPDLYPAIEAAKFLKAAFTTEEGDHPGIASTEEALEGARQILIEWFAEHARLLQKLRSYLQRHGMLTAKATQAQKDIDTKFLDYHHYTEAISKIPSHRALALFRGEREGVLKLKLSLDSEIEQKKSGALFNPCESLIAQQFKIHNQNRPADTWLIETVHSSWRNKICAHLETEFKQQLSERAETEAIQIFAQNLKSLLLAPPAGPHITIGLDPGFRTGVKVAVVDMTGKVLSTTTIYPHPPQNNRDTAIEILKQLAERHHASLVAIGNGTASRETDQLVKDLIKRHPHLKLTALMVSEAGASVYSASELAVVELPELDVSLRGAVSIARRLQDPLAELVKIDPKSIGVGQYQHDVNQKQLAQSLDAIVEDSVNAVGVNVNTASAALLQYVAGLNSKIARNIIAYRNENGSFSRRSDLLKTPGLGEKTFEQAAGFLRILHGADPLDATAVHPESYSLVKRILADVKLGVAELTGNHTILKSIRPEKYITDQFGLPTVKDILNELDKPGRDPRATFTSASFKEGIESIKDLHPGMSLEGVITNVTAFGAFVDIGVHQDGLVHISALSDKFVKDPHAVVKVGQVVKISVLNVDEKRKRIALTMRKDQKY